jgi:hypothetical protein
MGNMPPNAVKGEHLHQLNNYRRLKQEYTPEGKTAFTGYFQYFTDPDIHSLQTQRTVAKATAVQMTPHHTQYYSTDDTTPHTTPHHTTQNITVQMTPHHTKYYSTDDTTPHTILPYR